MLSDMASRVSPAGPESGFLALLRGAALIAVPLGAAGSVALTLYAGRHNPSWLLMALFALWVLSPFMALAAATFFLKRWPAPARVALYGTALVLALGSLALYGDVALGPPRAKPAFVFVVVPPASFLLGTIVVAIAALVSGKRSRRTGDI